MLLLPRRRGVEGGGAMSEDAPRRLHAFSAAASSVTWKGRTEMNPSLATKVHFQSLSPLATALHGTLSA